MAPPTHPAWSGLDATLRKALTPVALTAVGLLAAWALFRAGQGERIGGFGALLVLVVVGATGAKFAAETYLLSHLGGDDSPRQRSARRMVGPLGRLAKVRYVFGSLGGIVMPLAAQILAFGSKNVPAAADPTPSAVCAVLAAALLVVGESAERRLYRRSVDGSLPPGEPEQG